jgi:hypothetical protein
VKNRNNNYSISSGVDSVSLYWAKASSSLTYPDSWKSQGYFINGNGEQVPKNELIGVKSIPSLRPGRDTIVQFEWYPPNPEAYKGIDNMADGNSWHFCLMAIINEQSNSVGATYDPITHPVTSPVPEYFIRNNNNVASTNVYVVDDKPNRMSGMIGGIIAAGNVYDWAHPFCLKFLPESEAVTPVGKAEITVKLGNILYQAWERGGFQAEDAELIEDRTVLIKSPNSNLCNLIFEPHQTGLLDLRFNFLTRKVAADDIGYTYHIIQTDAVTNEVIGGEVYQISTSDRNLFHANAGEDIYAFAGEVVTLSAADIGEPAIYRWYDQAGNLISEEMDVEVDVEVTADNQRTYKLEVIALSDGFKDYDEVMVKIVPGKIEDLFPNPAKDVVTVTCVFNNVSSVYLTISNALGVIYAERDLATSPASVDFNLADDRSGSYIVRLICDGIVVDSKVFVKE